MRRIVSGRTDGEAGLNRAFGKITAQPGKRCRDIFNPPPVYLLQGARIIMGIITRLLRSPTSNRRAPDWYRAS